MSSEGSHPLKSSVPSAERGPWGETFSLGNLFDSREHKTESKLSFFDVIRPFIQI